MRVRRLDRCRTFGGCSEEFQLGAGLVTWPDLRTAYLYDIGRRRLRRFSPRAFRAYGRQDTGEAPLFVTHTRNTLFVSVPIVGTSRGSIRVRWRLYHRRLRRQ